MNNYKSFILVIWLIFGLVWFIMRLTYFGIILEKTHTTFNKLKRKIKALPLYAKLFYTAYPYNQISVALRALYHGSFVYCTGWTIVISVLGSRINETMMLNLLLEIFSFPYIILVLVYLVLMFCKKRHHP